MDSMHIIIHLCGMKITFHINDENSMRILFFKHNITLHSREHHSTAYLENCSRVLVLEFKIETPSKDVEITTGVLNRLVSNVLSLSVIFVKQTKYCERINIKKFLIFLKCWYMFS